MVVNRRKYRKIAVLLPFCLWAALSTAAGAADVPVSRTAGQDAADASAPVDSQPLSQMIPGNGNFLGPARRQPVAQTTVDSEGAITLNFVNADVKDVVKAVLGDYLKLNYEIASNVSGAVTIQTSRPLPRDKVLSILDQTLRLSGMAVIYANDIFKVVSIADAAHQSGAVMRPGTRRAAETGYGFEVAPIKYISAAEMQKLLEPLAPMQAVIHVDSTRNVLIIEGTEQERQILLDDIALFDADWLSGMSYALFTPVNVDAQELQKELTQVLGGANSPILGVVHLVAIDRLNTVLAISPQGRYLNQLRAWVERLDRPGSGSHRRIFVYSVQHGRSTDLAATLGKALFGTATTSGHAPPPPPPDEHAGGVSGTTGGIGATPGAPTTPEASEQFSGVLASSGSVDPVTITADPANNALVFLATPQQYATIKAALEQLDVTPLQVLIEAAIAEVTLTDQLQYGVQYSVQAGGMHQLTLTDTPSTSIMPAVPGFSYVYSSSNIKVVLDALSNITKVEVLSSPQLLVLNNQTATLQVGDQVPIVTEQAVSTISQGAPIVNSVQYQDTGVILKVTPRVNRGGEVLMDITQEVSNVETTTSSTIDSPTIQQRKIDSTVAVQDGETVALGGLITRQVTKTKTGIPYLNQIPVLGELLGDTNNSTNKTELMILITPHVVENVQQARSVTEELRRKLPSVQPLFEKSR